MHLLAIVASKPSFFESQSVEKEHNTLCLFLRTIGL